MGLTILYKDITKFPVDAIVNSSNPFLIGHSGVDKLLHDLGGEAFEAECRSKVGILKPGEAIYTKAYNVAAKYVIHTYIPMYHEGEHGEAAILRSCYRKSLELASELDVKSLAFPLIAAGTMQFPIPQALEIAVVTIREYLQLYSDMEVYLLLHGSAAKAIADSSVEGLDEYIKKSFSPEKKIDYTDLEQMLANKGESFIDILNRYMREKGKDKPSELYKDAGISKSAFSKLQSPDNQHKPSIETVVGLAFALKLTYEEAVPFFNAAGFALGNSSKYEIILTYYFMNKKYDIWELNEQLLKYGYKKLVGNCIAGDDEEDE